MYAPHPPAVNRVPVRGDGDDSVGPAGHFHLLQLVGLIVMRCGFPGPFLAHLGLMSHSIRGDFNHGRKLPVLSRFIINSL